MYKIDKVEIDGFWHQFDATCKFKPDVNIIIGKNGTGKTTFMNILYGVLAVDINSLEENDFEVAKITLVNGKRKRMVKATKLKKDHYSFPAIEYQLSKSKFEFQLGDFQQSRHPSIVRRHHQKAAAYVRQKLENLVSVTSLSVYRLRHDDDCEVRDSRGIRVISPVDYRLSQALLGLTQYQLYLSQKAGAISAKLQTDVLASILYGEEDAKEADIKLVFNKEQEQAKLISAYKQLNSHDLEIEKKIDFHVNAIDEVLVNEIESNGDDNSRMILAIKPIAAFLRTRKIIDLSLKAKENTQEIYSQLNKFLAITKNFISDKTFTFESGNLIIKNAQNKVHHKRLSSGEKQLIILLVEALLQDCCPHIFLADEPELSLHIAWQRMIIPAVKELNPNAQIIAATHSPEVASKYRESIFDMENLVNG